MTLHEEFDALCSIAESCYSNSWEHGWHDDAILAREIAKFKPDDLPVDLRDKMHAEFVRRVEAADGVDAAAKLMLIVTEASEALEVLRDPNLSVKKPYVKTPGGELVEYDAFNDSHASLKPEGFGSELADIIIRALDLGVSLGIDISDEVRRKMAYNETRPYRHGGKRL